MGARKTGMMTDLLKQAYSPEIFRRQGHALIERLAVYLEGVSKAPANPHATPDESLQVFAELLERGAGAEEIFEQVIALSVHLHSPNYLGHQVVPPAPLAALSDVAASLLNTGMAIFEMGRPGVAIERLVIERFAGLLRLDEGAGGFLTSGGTLANLTALLAARANKWPGGDAWIAGNGEVRPCLLVNEEAHYCIERAVKIMGWGSDGIIHVPADDQLRIRTDLIAGLIDGARDRGLTPIAIVGSACTTSTGTFDPLEKLADAANRHGLWLHIDGAHGAPVRLDPSKQHLTAGLERADSVTVDFHKMLMAPALTTGLYFRDHKTAYRTFHQRAEYLLGDDPATEDWSNIARRSFECTKRMMGLRVFTLLSEYGDQLFVDYVCRVNALGRELARSVSRQPDLQLFMQPDTNIVCFRFVSPRLDEAGRNGINQLIRQGIAERGQTYIVRTDVKGATYLRCTITNAFSSTENLEHMLLEVVTLGNELLNTRQSIGS